MILLTRFSRSKTASRNAAEVGRYVDNTAYSKKLEWIIFFDKALIGQKMIRQNKTDFTVKLVTDISVTNYY